VLRAAGTGSVGRARTAPDLEAWERHFDALEHWALDPLAHGVPPVTPPDGPLPGELIGRAREVLDLIGRMERLLTIEQDGVRDELRGLRQRRTIRPAPASATVDVRA